MLYLMRLSISSLFKILKKRLYFWKDRTCSFTKISKHSKPTTSNTSRTQVNWRVSTSIFRNSTNSFWKGLTRTRNRSFSTSERCFNSPKWQIRPCMNSSSKRKMLEFTSCKGSYQVKRKELISIEKESTFRDLTQ